MKTESLQSVEFRTYYDVPLHCPYCGTNPEGDLRDGGTAAPCAHTLFMGHDAGWIYISDRVESQLAGKGFTVERSEDLIHISKVDDDGEEEFVTLQDLQATLSFDDGVLFEQYVGPPSGFSSFVAFAGLDTEEN